MIMGHCVGGSSAINGMAVMRGTAQEYNTWAELGNRGSTWNWDGMLPYFRKVRLPLQKIPQYLNI